MTSPIDDVKVPLAYLRSIPRGKRGGWNKHLVFVLVTAMCRKGGSYAMPSGKVFISDVVSITGYDRATVMRWLQTLAQDGWVTLGRPEGERLYTTVTALPIDPSWFKFEGKGDAS